MSQEPPADYCEGNSAVTLGKAKEIAKLAAKLALDTQSMVRDGHVFVADSMGVRLHIDELAAIAETFRPIRDPLFRKSSAPVNSNVSQPVAGVKRRREDATSDVNAADIDGPAHPKPFACSEEMGPNFLSAACKIRAQKLLKYEPGLTAIGKFIYENLVTEHDTDHKNAKYYVRMVEMGVGDKSRLDWIYKRFEWMINEEKEFRGKIADCFVKRMVLAPQEDQG